MRTKTTTITAYAVAMLVSFTTFLPSTNAQEKKELEYRSGVLRLFGKGYYLDDKKTSKREVGELLAKENPEAYAMFKSAKVYATTGLIIYSAASVLFLYDIYKVLDSRFEEGGTLFLVSIGGFIAGGILGLTGEIRYKKAAKIYNAKAPTTGIINLNLGVTQKGRVGLTMTF